VPLERHLLLRSCRRQQYAHRQQQQQKQCWQQHWLLLT
jgi:hypothetical protein